MKFLLVSILLYTTSLLSQNDYTKIYVSKDIELVKISANSLIHISYFESPQFGRFPSNGLILVDEQKAFLFDTPMTEELTKELVSYLQDSMGIKIVGFIPNHWHDDCMGGLSYLQTLEIESYANKMTIEIAKSKNLPLPAHEFRDSLILMLGSKEIVCNYYGAGHSSDNIVVWIPSEKILFGGCMVKALSSRGLGNTADADIDEWSKTIQKVINKHPDAKIVIPGHGQFGGIELLNHTKELLTKNE
jgi:metallo-beta-lactamase class B